MSSLVDVVEKVLHKISNFTQVNESMYISKSTIKNVEKKIIHNSLLGQNIKLNFYKKEEDNFIVVVIENNDENMFGKQLLQ